MRQKELPDTRCLVMVNKQKIPKVWTRLKETY